MQSTTVLYVSRGTRAAVTKPPEVELARQAGVVVEQTSVVEDQAPAVVEPASEVVHHARGQLRRFPEPGCPPVSRRRGSHCLLLLLPLPLLLLLLLL